MATFATGGLGGAGQNWTNAVDAFRSLVQGNRVHSINGWKNTDPLAPLAKQLNLEEMTQNRNTVENTNETINTQERITESQLRQWQEITQEVMNEVVTRGDPASFAALQGLIQQLQSGGTNVDQEMRNERFQEIQNARSGMADYSKANAMLDADMASQAASRQAMEQSMANINRAIAGAGTSGGSMQALLAQRAARDAAETQAAMQLQAATQYGGIAAQYQGILEALTRPDQSQNTELLQALQLAMQANQTTNRTTTTDRRGAETIDKITDRVQNTTRNAVTTTDEIIKRLTQGLQLGGTGGGSVGSRSSGGGSSGSSGGGSSRSAAPATGLADSERTALPYGQFAGFKGSDGYTYGGDSNAYGNGSASSASTKGSSGTGRVYTDGTGTTIK